VLLILAAAACTEPKPEPNVAETHLTALPAEPTVAPSQAASAAAPANTTSPTSKPPRPSPGCAIPASAKRIVIAIHKHIVPHGADVRIERGQLTSDGVCEPDVECLHVDAATLDQVVDRALSLGKLRTTSAHASPHYGARFIQVRWDGGACEWGDSSTAPLVEEQQGPFADAFNAVVQAIVDARSAQKKP